MIPGRRYCLGRSAARCALFLLLTGCPQDQQGGTKWVPSPQKLAETAITVKDKTITVELARSPEQKAKGLMYRDSMARDHGMLFIYEQEEAVGYYMKNCRFPIAIAFIGTDGVIQQIETMLPREEMPTQSAKPVKYVLEMNKDWFKKNKIAVGDKISFRD